MPSLLVLALVGLFAQLVDGSLGMAYGVTSSSLLLVSGIAPAAASAAVHLSEVGTTSLLSSGRVEPRKVVGSIDTSEFLVAVGASLGFLMALGSEGIDFGWVAALLVGGMIAAPFAAWLVRHMPARVLGVAAGGLIILTNTKTVLESSWVGLEADGDIVWAVVGILALVWVSLIAKAANAERAARRIEVREPELVH
jgi:uncharacterized membrane protein YfcA